MLAEEHRCGGEVIEKSRSDCYGDNLQQARAGRLAVKAISNRDYALARGCLLSIVLT